MVDDTFLCATLLVSEMVCLRIPHLTQQNSFFHLFRKKPEHLPPPHHYAYNLSVTMCVIEQKSKEQKKEKTELMTLF